MASTVAHRQFYNFHNGQLKEVDRSTVHENSDHLLKFVDENVVGNRSVFSSPFGPRRVSYCDYTASGRSLRFIEDYILRQILPLYGSTHTTTSVTSLQTTLFRHEARDIIRNATRASEHDRVVFTGSGATAAIHKLIHGLKLTQDVVVFVDFFAHHSTLLPWREMGATVYRVRETREGQIDREHLEQLLMEKRGGDGCRLIGCFTAASNITGTIAAVDAVTILLHRFGALAFWDYATAAPYLDIAMNPILPDDSQNLAYKDAIFFSLHKFIGGVQTPGVLIAKKDLFNNSIPTECGGGTVFFVSRDSHRYLQDVEEREEGGTPPIVETIRGGMAMQLKMAVSPSLIEQRCFKLSERLKCFVSSTPNLSALGNMRDTRKLPILSFNVKKEGKLLHFNFVSALLNDLYGIQSRGGCACAGAYAQDLLGIDEHLASRFEALLVETPQLDRSHLRRREEHGNLEVLRPGFVRINLSFSAEDEQINFVLEAVKRVCEEGWKLLPQYIFNPETAEWKHHTNLVFKHRQWLQNISYSSGSFEPNLKSVPTEAPTYKQMLALADVAFEEATKVSQRRQLADQRLLFNDETNALLWFVCPSEAQKWLENSLSKQEIATIRPVMPFEAVTYPLSDQILKSRPDYVWRKGRTNAYGRFQMKTASELVTFPLSKTVQEEEVNTNIATSPLDNSRVDPLITKSDEKEDTRTGSEIKTNDVLAEVNETCENNLCLIQRPDARPIKSITPPKIKQKWVVPTKNIFTPTVEGIQHFGMIKADDKVLVCLSGGKDSLTLLHTLHQYQFYARAKGISFTLGAVTVDPKSSSYDPRPLIPYLASLGVRYLFEEQDILKQAMELPNLNSICSFCSRMKRGRIYAAARREGFNVLAMGQHLDDMAESFLMSTFHNGRLRTMKASYTVKEGDLRVIRPLVYVREKHLRYFAESNKLPIIPENCPACFESPKERHRVKQLLAQQEVLYPRLFWSLRTAMLPLLAIPRTGLENGLFGKKVLHRNSQEEEEDGENEEEESKVIQKSSDIIK